MSAVTWHSLWCVPGGPPNVTVQVLPDSSKSVASLSPLPLYLSRPQENVSVPCELSLLWVEQPLRCSQLQLEIECSARHVEIYAEGRKQNFLVGNELSEVYLGTYRGTKLSSDLQLFSMAPSFRQGDCNVLKSLQKLRVKFVSLTGEKNELNLKSFRCIYVSVEPVATINASAAGVAAKIAGVNLGTLNSVPPDVLLLLQGFVETIEQKIETKFARVIDEKLSILSQRLSLSERGLLQLHKTMNAKDTHVQARLNHIQQQFAELENKLNQFSIRNEAKLEENEFSCVVDTKVAELTFAEEIICAPSSGADNFEDGG
ncbi:hypothetical protein PsorP6_008915 [Peronosclerospora sorghi]|uniref:Uncharacterized protein n=1 Tax=Peronosclerospora sorghi TaxID=230839 RepID=A0ACC0W2X6_9STRA|nr:hypothetical protein PsorP6_008915 [Peronosclerospora sorghi]